MMSESQVIVENNVQSKINNKVRNSNFEILRIIAMLMILMHHTFQYTTPVDSGMNTFFWAIGWTLGKIGVVIFIIITGYFMVTQKITTRKILRLLVEIWFYSILTSMISIIFFHAKITEKLLTTMLFPIFSQRYWFMTCYMFLILASPFINLCLNNISAKKHLFLTLLLIIVTWGFYSSHSNNIGCQYLAFVTIYCMAAFIRLHPQEIFEKTKNNLVMLLYGCILLLVICYSYVFLTYNGSLKWGYIPKLLAVCFFICGCIVIYLTRKKQLFNKIFIFILILLPLPSLMEIGYTNYPSNIYYMNSVECGAILLVSFSLFITFTRLKPVFNKYINWIATSTFGIYLNHYIVRELIYKELDIRSSISTELYLPTVLLATFTIFIICLVIDKVREYLIFRPLSKPLDLFYTKVEKIVKEISEDSNCIR